MKLKLIILMIIVTILSCKKKEGDYIVEGKIINAGNKEPIDSVSITLRGGYPYNSGPFLQGMNDDPANDNYASTYTDENGYFKLIIEDERQAYIIWYKEGYNHGIVKKDGKELYNNNDVVSISPYGKHFVTIEYEAECSFFPIFKKIENNSDNDTLRVFVRTRELGDLANIKGYSEEYIGESPFTYLNSRAYGFVGDTYVYYKLEYTDNSTWKTKIDSVYVESFETYTDTIYY
jgi:hypothetical protein